MSSAVSSRRLATLGVARYLRRCGLAIGGFIVLIWAVWAVNAVLFDGALNALGIRPRTLTGLAGIPLHPLLHADVPHLLHNSIGILLFGTLAYLREEFDFWVVAGFGAIGGGLATWLVGRPVIHVGASGVIFALFGYLLFAGWFERRIGSMILSVLLFLGWGSVLLGMIPLQRGISWEGHLFGFLSGVVAARVLARRRLRRLAAQ